jgi:uncharacterized protein (DUF983 family)
MAGVHPALAGLACRCPACGKGRLFKGYLKVVETCDVCGKDLSKADSGDGGAVFIILIVGGVVSFLALYTELTVRPPMWVHMILWMPLTLILSLALARPFKGLMLAMQFHNKASEHRTDE